MKIVFGLACLCYTLSLVKNQKSTKYAVEDLVAEPDYRALRLKWKYQPAKHLTGFAVLLCETNSWRAKYPCKRRYLSLNAPGQESHDFIRRSSNGNYEASLYELRMLTNYSVNVEPVTWAKEDSTEIRNRALDVVSNSIIVTTKGFSARTTKCLGNVTDVEVTTGPYFSGKIEVEDKFDNRCAVYGDRRSGRQIYNFRIEHDICGSKVTNDSRIQTSIIVHENRDLVTHSSRRFLVVCNFLPGTLTIQAAVHVPRNLTSPPAIPVIGHSTDEDLYDGNKIDPNEPSNLRNARFLAPEKAAIHHSTNKKDSPGFIHATIPIIFTISALIGVIVFAWKQFYVNRKTKDKTYLPSLTDEAINISTEEKTIVNVENSQNDDHLAKNRMEGIEN